MNRMLAALFLTAAVVADSVRPHVEVRPADALIDERVSITVSGVAPGSRVSVAVRGWGDAPQWSSSATFAADASGVVDVTRMAPIKGDYEGVDPMGLFWSARRDGSIPDASQRRADVGVPPPQIWHVTASVDGAVVDEASLTRRVVASDVTMTAVRDRGLVGVFYQPSAPGRHPVVLVLSG